MLGKYDDDAECHGFYPQCHRCKAETEIRIEPQNKPFALNVDDFCKKFEPEPEHKTYWQKCPHHQEIRRFDRPPIISTTETVEFHCIGGDVHIAINDSGMFDDGTLFKEYLDYQMKKACEAHCSHMKKIEPQKEGRSD